MPASPLEQKTVRPGSLRQYSYYSNRTPAKPLPATNNSGAFYARFFMTRAKTATVLAGALVLIGLFAIFSGGSNTNNSSSPQPASSAAAQAAAGANVTPVPSIDRCAGNALDRFVLISISKRHMWACELGQTVHEAPIITGMLAHASTLTPPGTYTVYAKTTETTLTGSDEAGSWNRSVHYWMPFLDNEHGTYGFHDATWRPDTEFGKINPASDEASHGCVELPLVSMKWLYEWAPAGTTLTVES